jgi:hypothetical protein
VRVRDRAGAGGGAELCLGGVEESLPPQCSGPRLVGWDWSEHAGDFEHRGGVRWGDFQVTGSFADGEMTPSEVVPLAELGEPAAYDDGSLQRSLDDQYGAGTVRIQSALVPVGHSMLVD